MLANSWRKTAEREREDEGTEQDDEVLVVLVTSELHHLFGLALFGDGVDNNAVTSVDITLGSRNERIVDQLTGQLLQRYKE